MLPSKDTSRIDTLELKAMIFQKIGYLRSEKYFDLLRKLISSKISKPEFDKFCSRIIGKEIIPLHNRLIRAILRNVVVSKVPPLSKGTRKVGGSLSVKTVNGYQRSCLRSLNEDAFLSSPRKGRSPVNRDHRIRDRASHLGPYGKPHNIAVKESALKGQEQQTATELHSLGSRPPIEMASVEEGEEVEQTAGSPGVQSRSPVTAPFGVSMNFIGSGRTLSNASTGRCYPLNVCQNGGELPDTRSLKTRLERKLEEEQIYISVEGANLLNNALDVYLKRLIEPCLSLSGSRRGQFKSLDDRPISASRNGFHEQLMYKSRQANHASLLDFHVAMQSNPQVLGKDWTVQLEKISLRASEE